MIRLAWRQFRTEASIGIGALAVVAVVLAITGPHLMSVSRTAPNELASTDHALQVFVQALLLVVPALVGIFFGAPLVARELETGTYRLVWTQSVSRLRWLGVKFILVGVASSLLAGCLSLIVAWWANPVDIFNQNRFTPSNFGMLGIVPFGYGLFAFALGATAGLVFRRTLPAMASTLAGFIAVRIVVSSWVRAHFESPLQRTAAVGSGSGISFERSPSGLSVMAYPPNIPNAWPLSAQIVDKAGHAPTSAFLASACPGLGAPGGGVASLGGGRHSRPFPSGSMQTCVANIAHKFHLVVTYQPASRYWPFQIYETALFFVLALALAGVSFWWVRRRLT